MKSIKKRIAMLLCASMVLSLMCVGAFAAGGDSSGATTGTSAEVISAFQTGFLAIKSDAMSMIAVAAPIALSIAAVIFLARKAMSWFKSMAK